MTTIKGFLGTFTFERQTIKANALKSAGTIHDVIELVKNGEIANANKATTNTLSALKNYMGVFEKSAGGIYSVSQIGENFEELYSQNKEDAFAWLLTRSLWLYLVPNGTEAGVNKTPVSTHVRNISFFRNLIVLLTQLSALPDANRFFYYEEFFELFIDDATWQKNPLEVFGNLLDWRRSQTAGYLPTRGLLDDLEADPTYGDIPRDNWNGMFHKFLRQTGMFEFKQVGTTFVGIALKHDLDLVRQKRIRFIIDHPVQWEGTDKNQWLEFLISQPVEIPVEASEDPVLTVTPLPDPEPLAINEMIAAAHTDFQEAGLNYDIELIRRFVASLIAKNFVILSGLSGSGKTRLAQALAIWSTSRDGYAIVPVGADWTSRESVLGYADALDPTRYVRTQALNLILEAVGAQKKPHFLILDEMNLSHVERYFADLLSAIESGEPLQLHTAVDDEGKAELRDGVPSAIPRLPSNLFIIGTINVDETTYMFSPKVLDRANVIEFRADWTLLSSSLTSTHPVNIAGLSEAGAGHGLTLVAAASEQFPPDMHLTQYVKEESGLFFEILSDHNAEFGFRTLTEMTRYMHAHRLLTGPTWLKEQAWDHQILQKILPKMNGSRKKLEPLLCALAIACQAARQRVTNNDGIEVLTNDRSTEIRQMASKAASFENPALHPLSRQDDGQPSIRTIYPGEPVYPLSYRKIEGMLRLLERDGFVNFAEA